MLSHPSIGESKNDSKEEVPVDRPWSLRFSIVPRSMYESGALLLGFGKKTPALSSHYGWSLMRGIYCTFFLKVPDGGIELMLGINKSTFANGQYSGCSTARWPVQ